MNKYLKNAGNYHKYKNLSNDIVKNGIIKYIRVWKESFAWV